MAVLMCTGHREIQNPVEVQHQVDLLSAQINPELCISGGAEGADTIFAVSNILRDKEVTIYYPNQYYRFIYPNAYQPNWEENTINVVDRPDVDDWKKRWYAERWWLDNHTRNIAMIEASTDAVVISPKDPRELLKEKKGGTAHCVKALAKAGREVYWISDSKDYSSDLEFCLINLSKKPKENKLF